MNLLTLNPISSCNLSCEHCPNKEWTYPIDDNEPYHVVLAGLELAM